ncbi:hypothetical protein GALMADRAFT_148060 [Galerina marginata CBS 339.88]|uniref:Uncharacterized protein n=1 Tax=Galerina marginata (strain CBS 339.88) TaxID=685588 RepID=A0A067S5N5_GALM3|nr:hypothetical protein GALMADRAFT_148060 [Galerina marginata CBS 339.88]
MGLVDLAPDHHHGLVLFPVTAFKTSRRSLVIRDATNLVPRCEPPAFEGRGPTSWGFWMGYGGKGRQGETLERETRVFSTPDVTLSNHSPSPFVFYAESDLPAPSALNSAFVISPGELTKIDLASERPAVVPSATFTVFAHLHHRLSTAGCRKSSGSPAAAASLIQAAGLFETTRLARLLLTPPAHFATIRGTGENSSTTAAGRRRIEGVVVTRHRPALLPTTALDGPIASKRRTAPLRTRTLLRASFTLPGPSTCTHPPTPACWHTHRTQNGIPEGRRRSWDGMERRRRRQGGKGGSCRGTPSSNERELNLKFTLVGASHILPPTCSLPFITTEITFPAPGETFGDYEWTMWPNLVHDFASAFH